MNIKNPTHDSLSAALFSRAKHGNVLIGLDEIDLAQLGITQSTPAPAAFAAHGFATTDPAAHAPATGDFATAETAAHAPVTADFATATTAANSPTTANPTPRAAAHPSPEPPEHAQLLLNGALLLYACGSAAQCAEQLSASIPPETADCALLCRMPANAQLDELSHISDLARSIAGCRMGVVTDDSLSECEVTLYIPSRQSAVKYSPRTPRASLQRSSRR